MKPFAGIPGPPPSFPLGNGGDFSDTGDEPWLTFQNYIQTYGDLLVVWFGWSPRLLVGSPELLAEILGEHGDSFYKKDPVEALLPILTSSAPFLANGSRWPELAERDLPNMPGIDPWLAGQLEVVRATVRERVDTLAHSPAVWADTTRFTRKVGFEAFSRMGMGQPLPDSALADLLDLAGFGTKRMDSMLPLRSKLSGSQRRVYDRWMGRFRTVVQQARRDLSESRTDMLATTLRSGTPLDDEGLAIALSNLYFGGMFSSTTALATCLYHLTRNPELKSQLASEVRPVVGAGRACSWAELDQCQLLDQCVREALRLDSPVPVFMRNSSRERAIRVGGHSIPRDTTIYISSWAMHRDPRHWERPDTYDPHRWTDEVKDANPYGSGWFFPFGMGPRACSGQTFALLFIKAALAEIACGFDYQVGVDRPYKSKLFFAVQEPGPWPCSFDVLIGEG